jgi:hypothetical protein
MLRGGMLKELRAGSVERNITFILFIAGVGIALGGVVRLFMSNDLPLAIALIAAGSFLAWQTWSFVKSRFGL